MHWCHRFLKCFWNFQAFAILTSPPPHTFAPNLPKPGQKSDAKRNPAKMRNPRKISKSDKTEMWPDGESALGFGQPGQHLNILPAVLGNFAHFVNFANEKVLWYTFTNVLTYKHIALKCKNESERNAKAIQGIWQIKWKWFYIYETMYVDLMNTFHRNI